MGVSQATLTIYRKPKDGVDGKSPVIIDAPAMVAIPCAADGSLKNSGGVGVPVRVFRGTEDISGAGLPAVYIESGCSASIANNVLTIVADADSGYVLLMAQGDWGTLTKKVSFAKMKDGEQGEPGEPGTPGEPGKDALYIECGDLVVTTYASGALKVEAQAKARVVKGSATQSGYIWSLLGADLSAGKFAATIDANGLITVTGYTEDGTLTVKADGATGILSKDVRVIGVSDGAKGAQGLAGDTMLYKGEWSSTTTYRQHYEMVTGSGKYFTDYVSYGVDASSGLPQFYAVKVNNLNKTPTNSTYWTKFATSEYIATQFVISDQIFANLIEAVQLHAAEFYAQTINGQTINANYARINNLTVSGVLNSTFRVTTFGSGVYGMYDTLNLLVTNSSSTEYKERTVRLYNDARYIGSRVIIGFQPLTDEGEGYYQEDGVVIIQTGWYYSVDAQAETQITTGEYDYFLGTNAVIMGGNIYPAKTIKIWGSGFIELVGVPAPMGAAEPVATRWMVMSVHGAKDVEYLR